MEQKMRPSVRREGEKTSYDNFNLALYCPVGNVNQITDLELFDRKFQAVFGNMKIGRVYIEDFRGLETTTREQILKVKNYFESRGIRTAGGLTTCGNDAKYGFASLCYSDEEVCRKLEAAVRLNAEIFDEILMDDFYFLNCRCPKCVALKGNRSWREFRLAQKRRVTEEVIMKPAHEVNPDINVIVKFPQWFEDFANTGFDLDTDTSMFDSIYTGTESRNPEYAQQHLPKYISYFTMRYYGSDVPGSEKPSKNLGGWFDPFECTYNMTSFLSQAYLTLFAKPREVTMFCIGSYMDDPQFRLFAPALGELWKEVDSYLGKLGQPVGIAAYHPSGGRGENNIHSILGECGIPMEPCLNYPENEDVIFLAESSAADEKICERMKKGLMEGKEFIVTSGFVKALGKAFEEFGYASYTDRKAFVKSYCISENNGVNISRKFEGSERIIIPQIDYNTNDQWEIAGAYANNSNYPIVLTWVYGNGRISVITVPDNMADMYCYPAEVLNAIRNLFVRKTGVVMEGPARVQMFLFDNSTMVLRSDLPYEEKVTLRFADPSVSSVSDITATVTGTMESKEMDDKMVRQSSQDGVMSGSRLEIDVVSGVNRVLKIQ